MLLDRPGAEIYYAGKKYVIGEEIIATDASDYEGLIGRITEIRDGEDRETENDTPDIYCEFAPPVMQADIFRFEQTMSALYGERKTIEDITLDMVIMAPEMIKTLAEIEGESPVAEIYLLTEDWAANDAYGNSTEAFTSLEFAQISMKKKLAEEKQTGCIPVWKDEADFVEDESDMIYSAYREGFWCESHYELTITKVNMRMTPAFLCIAHKHYDIQNKHEDFVEQTNSWESLNNLPDKVIYELNHSKDIADRVEKKLSKNDSYWTAYWESFSEVAHDMVREAGGEQ